MPKQYDDNLPIPTYEEATSSRPPSSQSFRDSANPGDHEERQGLLGQAPSAGGGRRNYQPPSVESQRSSLSDPMELQSSDGEQGDEELRRDMEEMDIDDSPSRPPRIQLNISKRLASISETFSAISFPSFSSLFSRIPPVAPGYRISWPILARLFGLFLLVAIIYGLILAHSFKMSQAAERLRQYPETIRSYVQSQINGDNIRQYLREISYDDHLAGTKGDFYLAEQIEEQFTLMGLEKVHYDYYEVYLNYPKPNGRRVAIVHPPELAWEAKLEENRVEQDPDPDQDHRVPRHQTAVFHGHSRAGDVTGPLIYANYGSKEDFQRLKGMGISLEGAIVLVRYYGTQGDRAMKVKLAELAGAAGCLIYSDPAEDGFKKGKTWPEGRWRNRDSVQRGAVSLMSWVVGDVLTPGYASLPDADRLSIHNNSGLVNIPSLPLSWGDAQHLLQALKGHGQLVPEGWQGGVPEVPEWWTGSGESSPQVQLKNEQDESERQPIRNVIGQITGSEDPKSLIYVGNHRDAWCFGAVDPGSGTAIMLELIRVFGRLAKEGRWKPRRTIVFASWDAEEYNLIGSTEHVEEHIDELRTNALAYINIDTGVSGENFWASASPLFERPLLRVLNRVTDPRTNKTLKTLWHEKGSRLLGLGAGSDYVAFQDLAGCSSIDFGFLGKPHSYPYHSCYETYDWMAKYGDPGFRYHEVLGQVWALLILQLADEGVVPYDFRTYAEYVREYVVQLDRDSQKLLKDAGEPASKFNMRNLHNATKLFLKNAQIFMAQESGSAVMETPEQEKDRIYRNKRMGFFERALLDTPQSGERLGGIPGREQFKHVIFGPQAWSGYEEAYFPAVRDALEVGNWTAAQKQLDIAAEVLQQAAYKLLH